ncbi:MAG: type II toxin-antitoxin system Phd/YefM family antitoxin [Parvularculaceae bacterium]
MVRHINIAEDKAKLSELVEAASRGVEIVLARHGKPMARLSPITNDQKTSRRNFGQNEAEARGIDWEQWWRDWKALDAEIEADFEESEIFPRRASTSLPDEKRGPKAKAARRGRKSK